MKEYCPTCEIHTHMELIGTLDFYDYFVDIYKCCDCGKECTSGQIRDSLLEVKILGGYKHDGGRRWLI